jgi:hypothetical protein
LIRTNAATGPAFLGGTDLLVVASLGDRVGVHPAESVDGAVFFDVAVVEVVEVTAQLSAIDGGLVVALGAMTAVAASRSSMSLRVSAISVFGVRWATQSCPLQRCMDLVWES